MIELSSKMTITKEMLIGIILFGMYEQQLYKDWFSDDSCTQFEVEDNDTYLKITVLWATQTEDFYGKTTNTDHREIYSIMKQTTGNEIEGLLIKIYDKVMGF